MDATKVQWSSARNVGIALVLGIALIAGIAQSVPTWVSVAIGVGIGAFIVINVVRFVKTTYYHSKVDDVNSSK